MSPPDFGRSVNPISTKGGRLCPSNNAGTPGFSDLPTALMMFTQLNARPKKFLWGWLLALNIKDGPVKCAKVCGKSVVIPKLGNSAIRNIFVRFQTMV